MSDERFEQIFSRVSLVLLALFGSLIASALVVAVWRAVWVSW